MQHSQGRHYHRARLGSNDLTSTKRQAYVLLESEVCKVGSLEDLAEPVFPPNSNLKLDLQKAFSQFSAIEQRLLYRILVEGQSVEKATARFKTSAARWRKWYHQTARPKLQQFLCEYREGEKLLAA